MGPTVDYQHRIQTAIETPRRILAYTTVEARIADDHDRRYEYQFHAFRFVERLLTEEFPPE